MNFKKMNGLIPVIVQDSRTRAVLMLGYMNEAALVQTKTTGLVTFYSRSKQGLWVKGETSGHYLQVESILVDCDDDAILIHAEPIGPTCHTGKMTCFGDQNRGGFLYELEKVIEHRIATKKESSYSYALYRKGINKMAQKVGEEAVELVIEAKDDDLDLFKNEAADLLYHFLVLLKGKGVRLSEVEAVLSARSKPS